MRNTTMETVVLRITAVLIAVMVLYNACLASDAVCTDTIGKEFHLGVLESYSGINIYVALVVSGNTVGEVTIEAPSINMNHTFTLTNKTHTETISGSILQLHNNSVEDKSIKVSSVVDISLTLITYGSSSNEQTLVIPTTCLSTRYIVSAYQPNRQYPDYKSNFLVVATQDNTSVDIAVRINKYITNNFTIHMDNMQSYLYQNIEDISGSIIGSDQPIAVFSGHEAIVFFYGAYVSEQLLPSVYYGSVYIVPSLYPKTRYFIRIYSSEPDTRIYYRNITDKIDNTALLNYSGDFIEIINSEPLYIRANQPVSVMLYSFDLDDQGDTFGDPFLSVVPATTQYMTEYTFTVSNLFSGFTNYLSIIAPEDVFIDIQLDGRNLPNVSNSFKLTINGRKYFVNTYIVETGFHRLVQLKRIPFGAMLYGFASRGGYGTSLGIELNRPPVKVPIQQCYSCQDLSHLYLCDTVTTCDESQTCFVEQYRTVGGDKRFNSGCIDIQKCTNQTSSDCLECCDGDYCNSKGCSAQELPPRDNRGPLCFDCQHVANMTECHTIRLCSPGQVCAVEKYTWGGLYDHFTAKCHSQHCVSRRSVPDCLHCCEDDFCNTECKVTNTDPTFVG